jgi:hypothetical protein
MAGGAGGPPPGTVSDPGASLAAALMAAMARRQQQQQMREMAVAPGPGLQEVLKPEVLTPLLQDPEVSMLVMCYSSCYDMLLCRGAVASGSGNAGDGCCPWPRAAGGAEA